MLREINEKNILNDASVTNEVSNIKSRLKKHSITFFQLALARFGNYLFKIVQTLSRSTSTSLYLLNWTAYVLLIFV